eukprot:7137822-Prymnesium_polylepis.1
MVLTFSLAGTALVYFGARDAERALDMATAMQSAHFFLVTFVTKEMPQNWIWWCTAMPLFFIQGRLPQAWLGHFACGGSVTDHFPRICVPDTESDRADSVLRCERVREDCDARSRDAVPSVGPRTCTKPQSAGQTD